MTRKKSANSALWALASIPMLIVGIASGCGEGTTLSRLQPEISVDQTSLDFQLVPVGATRRIALTVRNTGVAPLEVAALRAGSTVAGPNPYFATPPAPLTIPPGGQVVIDVGFAPQVNEQAPGSVVISSNDPDAPELTVELIGQGGSGDLVVQPETLELRNTTVGVARSVELVVQNLGTAPVEGRLVAEGFERPEHFRLTGLPRFDQPTSFAVDTRVRQILVLVYEPQALGDDEGLIRVETCGPRCGPEVVVSASANEAALRLVPPSVDFGGVGIGEPKSEVIQIENVGTMVATVDAVRAAGNAAFVAQLPSGTLPVTIAPGQSVAVNVTFTPIEANEARGSLVVNTNLGALPEIQASLSGQGEGPLFFIEPTSISFGVERGPGRYERSVLLANGGSSTVRVSSLAVTGSVELSLGPVPGLPLSLGPGESLVVPIVFRPNVVGQFGATLSVVTDDPANPTTNIDIVAGMAESVCNLSPVPRRLLFGLMPPGHNRVRRVELTNVGNDVCELVSGDFRAPIDPSIRVLNPPAFPIRLTPVSSSSGAHSLELLFEYKPLEPRGAKATYVLQTGDLAFPERTISLSGTSDEYRLVFVRPPAVDFGKMTAPNCPEFVNTVDLVNAGLTSVIHRQSVLTSPDGRLAVPLEFRLAPGTVPRADGFIAPGEIVTYELGYRARQNREEPDLAELEITLDGYPQPLVVPLQGEGSVNPERTELFNQDDNKEVDVLFVIDDSCSMDENQRQVAANFEQFIQQADTRQVDFRLGITTTDTGGIPGELVGPVITRQTPMFKDEFQRQAAVGISGSGTERGLEAMRGALDEAARGNGFNADLIRPGAALVVIIVSDEDDQSSLTPAQYANDLIQRSPNGILAAAVSGQMNGCSSTTGTADPGVRYEQFLSFFGNGVSASICADWGVTLGNLGGRAFGLRRAFRLAIRPSTSEPLEVTINGSVVRPPAYELVGQDVVFAVPPPEGAEIEVKYSPDC